MRLPGTAYKGFEFLSPYLTAGRCLSIDFLGFSRHLSWKEEQRMFEEDGLSMCVKKSVCHRVLGRTGTSVLARLPPCSLDLDLPCYCLAKQFYKGSAERDMSYLVHNWIYNCHIQYINPNYLTLLCCSARTHLSKSKVLNLHAEPETKQNLKMYFTAAAASLGINTHISLCCM